MDSVMQEREVDCLLGDQRWFVAKEPGWIEEIPYRVSDTEEHKAISDPGTEQHRKPSPDAEFRLCRRSADSNASILPKGHIEAKDNKQVYCQGVDPAAMGRNITLRNSEIVVCLLAEN